ncbi:bifunctional 5,10-methylenetetrahydrofolate dehydrogenase / 5,10-methenyltetrahydrofolate cyclohydrolase [Galdieria sulphuraria]|uniref:Bifunctional 5,10-methylenetetrahydrofolate dehydrogenase / 5,10-methenyltetrahydrofolate cyclohydrolase n=1 Tax=Galdieria sulphuraria TaxID=130081 RepID=M2W6L1_GALSU|nr:bifunctional 5,10-methylenetetrahydrofolate dehydrogenase / 5,10-methenyltetrahydrofolate cyclohydrolase [Galdieria sulphuraria]EME31396.1 bifunctional 5,10-methylenetetrahydrofolate dehydrogenase / 5,10-methenyltetrahydrofolate cyclohydrolase [Galdieria sulphuraria]|eukprot:XP_005707916.1 bifunctional 5,10-methylenetetrahydrofolate dehydrogenase / 5,10-methenyltetrahydrofolate cyclohydrolase [Galdieria sulphuraria]
MAKLIDGKAIAATIREEIRVEVRKIEASVGKVPGLATVLVGNRTDSTTYVRMKRKACEEVGIESFHVELPESVSEEELLNCVERFNADPAVHGILVQLPLPKHIDEERILSAISVEKDVDGFHPLNIGRLAMKSRTPRFVPCTPRGCIELLVRSNVNIEGKCAVVLGRSNIVGLPVSLLLLHRNATVIICHSKTQELPSVCRQGDILIAAVGRANMVKRDWIKPGAVVIDVGINSIPDASKKSGYRLVGDVDFDDCKDVCGMITPVPGGTGPMTIAMLLRNCCDSAKEAFGLS